MLRAYYVLTADKELSDSLIHELSPYRGQKALLCKNPHARQCSLGASLALRQGLADLGYREKDMNYSENCYGKPSFADIPWLHFSLTHTENFAVAVFSDSPVGADCESIRRSISHSVLRRFFSESEVSAYYDHPIALWTLKESYSKFLGEPFAKCTHLINIPFFSDYAECCGVFFHRVEIFGFSVAICTGKSDIPEYINVPLENITINVTRTKY